MSAASEYLLGHSEAELKRLTRQARLIDPITERFFRSAGIAEGMRILDVGSGAGDVALLCARLVGPSGSVLGTDVSQTAVATAARRTVAAGLKNVAFRNGDPALLAFDQPFDAVVGRYVLQFLPDPAASLARLAQRLRPGGLMVFHELDWSGARSEPAAPTFDLTCSRLDRTIGSLAQSRLGLKLASIFRQAGLPPATMQLEAAIGSGAHNGEIVLLVTELVETLLPTMERIGVATEAEIGLPSLEERILAEIGADTVLLARSEVAAWTRV